MVLNDIWALSLDGAPVWNQLVPGGTPPTGRGYHTAIYDPVRDRMLVFGGFLGGSCSDEVWSLSLGAAPVWSQIVATGTPPTMRSEHTAVYDPTRDRMVVFGGYDCGLLRNDLWALTLSDTPAWSQLLPESSPPSPRSAQTAIHDALRDRMIVFGGDYYPPHGPTFNDAWVLAWSGVASATPDENHPSRSLELALPRPNPSRGEIAFDINLRQATQVSLDVFDATGRLVRHLVEGNLSVGRHSIVWDGRDTAGKPLPSGIYLVRTTAPLVTLVRRVSILLTGARRD